MVKIEKILILSNLCVGGVETFSVYLAIALKREGHYACVINQNEVKRNDKRFSKSLELSLIKEGIPILSIEESLSSEYFDSTSKFIIPFYASKYLELFYSQVVRNNTLPLLYGYIHSDGAYYYDNAFLYESITSNFICVSESIKSNLSVILNEKQKLIYQKCPLLLKAEAIDVSSNKEYINLLFVGRINDEPKGVFKLVTIAKYLEKNSVLFKMNIIGNGVDVAELKNRFVKAGISSEINIITDADTPEKVVPFYGIADVLLILSSYEGGPLVLYEAMEFGIIPVGFNVGVMTQLIENGVSGYVFEHDQFDLLLEQIKLLSKCNSLPKLKSSAQNKIRSLNMSMDNYLVFINNIFINTKVQYPDVSIRKTNSKLKWKKNDLQNWVRKILNDSVLKRNHIFHYFGLIENNSEYENSIKVQKHYLEVYENMPMWWKKIGAFIRKIR